jgi:pimeloyl-ACP methyl ester carboxylesterase
MWRTVIPLLEPDYDTIALTALGHRGGRPGFAGVTVQDLVDDAERSLDDLGIGRPHLVGNSLGGWMAIELARRGRAASVCALFPAGCCPVVLAWSERDRILPVSTSGARARSLMPRADWRVVPGVGHVPMFDDPRLVAAVIRESIETFVHNPEQRLTCTPAPVQVASHTKD